MNNERYNSSRNAQDLFSQSRPDDRPGHHDRSDRRDARDRIGQRPLSPHDRSDRRGESSARDRISHRPPSPNDRSYRLDEPSTRDRIGQRPPSTYERSDRREEPSARDRISHRPPSPHDRSDRRDEPGARDRIGHRPSSFHDRNYDGPIERSAHYRDVQYKQEIKSEPYFEQQFKTEPRDYGQPTESSSYRFAVHSMHF